MEDWVTEAQLGDLLTKGDFQHLGLGRITIEVPSLRYIPAATAHDARMLQLLPIYQVWACRRHMAGGETVHAIYTQTDGVGDRADL